MRPVIDHLKIFSLHYVFYLKESNVKLYVMPKYPMSLNIVIRSSEFLANRHRLNRIHKTPEEF